MEKLIPLLFVVGAVIVVLKALSGALGGSTRTPAPIAKRFMTRRELAILTILERCLPQYRFHAQVSMGALLDAKPNRTRRTLPSDRNAFSQKIVDFVAQDRETGDVVALIEVDDRTHNALRTRDATR